MADQVDGIEATGEEEDAGIETETPDPQEQQKQDATESSASETDEADDEPEGDSTDAAASALSEADALRLRLEAAEREAQHFRQAHDSLSGKSGETIRKLRGRLDEMGQRLASLETGDDGYERQRSNGRSGEIRVPALDSVAKHLQQDRQERQTERARQAFAGAVTNFERSIKAEIPPDVQQVMKAHLAENRDSIADAIETGDASTVEIVTQRLLSEGLLRGMKSRTDAATERNKQQTAELRGQKQLATAAGTQPRRSQPAKPKRPEDMTTEELIAYYRSIGRKGF